MLEPETQIHQTTVTRRTPVVVGHGKKQRIEYVDVEEPFLSITTLYRAFVLVQAEEAQGGTPLWRTRITSAGGSEDFRALLRAMQPVLPAALGADTPTLQHYDIAIDDDGTVSVSGL